MTSNELIQNHYLKHHKNLVKKFIRAAGTVWDAEDVVQTGYESALRYHHAGVQDIDKWVGTTIRSALIDHLNAQRGIIYEELDEHGHEVEGKADEIQSTLTIQKMIKAEPEDNRPILELHFLQGYKAIEIYTFNSVTYPNTRKIIQRFRDKLKKEFNKDEGT